MCIIIAKYKGNKLPKKETLENCFYNNNDGAGISYTYKNKVFIKKGFNKFDEFYKELKHLDKEFNLKDENVILHFRIGTSGNMDARATHPFPITDNVKQLQAPELNNLDVAVAHNGVISKYAYKNEFNLSDTQNFIKDFLTPLKELQKNFYYNKKVAKLIKDECNSKLAIIDKKTITLIGEFEKAEDGNFYSNGSFKTDYYKNSIKNYYSYNWSDYDDEYYEKPAKYIHYKRADNLMILDDGMYYQEDARDNIDELVQCDNWQCIDEHYNLYDIIDYYTANSGTTYYSLQKVADNIVLFDESFDIVPFKPNTIEAEAEEEGGDANG